MIRLAVIDHGAGNLVSIGRALATVGAEPVICTEPDELSRVDGIVLPGVGATGAAMRRLEATGMSEALRSWRGPLLGICVGLQLLFTDSAEDDGPCLGILPGRVEPLTGRPLPHMGWNDVTYREDPLFRGIPQGTTFYFVHGYAPVPADPDLVVATAVHGAPFTAAVRRGPLVGVQFHPERSGPAGLRLLANFVDASREEHRAA